MSPALRWRQVLLALGVMLLAADSSVALEPEPWRRLASGPPFPPAIQVPMGVYDPVRRRVLTTNMGSSREPMVVYAFEPAPVPHWYTLEVSGGAPITPYLGSVLYDPRRDRLVVIGRVIGQSLEVWALTLSAPVAWERVTTVGDPPGRGGHSTIYDPIRDAVVMFGDGSETWSLSLATGEWAEIATSGAQPPAREGHGALYDPAWHRMLVFGGHWEGGGRIFRNDLWQLSLGESATWSEISPGGTLPGPRSAFGTVYDPVRRRMLVHGGINAQSGIEPDDLWALSLDGTPAWTPIVPEDTLRGRSYPVDVYDPVGDRLLACGGAGYAQFSALDLSDPMRWAPMLPACCPLPAPGARAAHGVLYDSLRDRFLVIGGEFSQADSAVWSFRPEGDARWQAVRAPAAPHGGFFADDQRIAAYDSLGDRVLMFDGWRVWPTPADRPGSWTTLIGHEDRPGDLGSAAGVALDSRRNRLIVTGGFMPAAHSAGYAQDGVWALSLGEEPAWSLMGRLPAGSYGHEAFYDPLRDRLVIVGGMEVYDRPVTRRAFGAMVWMTPVDSALQWNRRSVDGDAALPGPPAAHAAYDSRTGRVFLASDSTMRVRRVDSPGPWGPLPSTPPSPTIKNAIAYDPIRDQVLALFAAPSGSTSVEAWALAVGPASVSVLGTDRTVGAITIRFRSVTAWGHAAALERREEGTGWRDLGPLEFGVDGIAVFTDRDIQPEHDYFYRVRVAETKTVWYSEQVFIPAPGSPRLALYGARPNSAAGSLQLVFSLPAAGPARLEVFDIRGRKLASRDVGSLGPGMHTLRVQESATWSAGVYYARLQRGAESHGAKLVLLR